MGKINIQSVTCYSCVNFWHGLI